jgi:hypothetical protein
MSAPTLGNQKVARIAPGTARKVPLTVAVGVLTSTERDSSSAPVNWKEPVISSTVDVSIVSVPDPVKKTPYAAANENAYAATKSSAVRVPLATSFSS